MRTDYFSDCWVCLFYLPGENVGSLSHTLHLDSLPGNPREEILNYSFLLTVVVSQVLETFCARPAEANRISTRIEGISHQGSMKMLLVSVMRENSNPKHWPMLFFYKTITPPSSFQEEQAQ